MAAAVLPPPPGPGGRQPPAPPPFAVDALYPPLFLALSAIVVRLAPFAVAAIALPPLAGVGAYLCVVRGAGVDARRLHETRLVSSAAFSLAALAGACFLAWQAPLLPPAWAAAQVAIFGAYLVLHVFLSRSDPGTITSSPPTAPLHHAGVCSTCRVLKSLRSKHCPACRACVARFDHHCPVVGACVGEGNQRAFTALLLVAAVGQPLYCALAAASFRAAAPAGAEASAVFAHASAHSPGLLLLTLKMAPLAAGSVFLAGRALALAAVNLTVNEFHNRHRYAYLLPTDGASTYDNRFDRGFALNCAQFWGGERDRDWSAELEASLAARGGKLAPAGDAELVPLAADRV